MKKTDLSRVIGSLWFIGDREAIGACSAFFQGKDYVKEAQVTDRGESISECAVTIAQGDHTADILNAVTAFASLRFTTMHAGRREMFVAFSDVNAGKITADESVGVFDDNPYDWGWEDVKKPVKHTGIFSQTGEKVKTAYQFDKKRWEAGLLTEKKPAGKKAGVKGLRFAVSGTLRAFPNKGDMAIFLKSIGAEQVTSVNADTDYVVTRDPEKNTAVLTKAREIGVPVITEAAFCEMTALRFPDKVEGVVPDWVTDLPDEAFRDCKSMETVVLPEKLKSIGFCAFLNCSALREVVIPQRVKSIHSSTFKRCISLRSVTIPEGVKKIEGHAFDGCESLEEIEVPASVTRISESAFAGCTRLSRIVLRGMGTLVEKDAFIGCPGTPQRPDAANA